MWCNNLTHISYSIYQFAILTPRVLTIRTRWNVVRKNTPLRNGPSEEEFYNRVDETYLIPSTEYPNDRIERVSRVWNSQIFIGDKVGYSRASRVVLFSVARVRTRSNGTENFRRIGPLRSIKSRI